MANDIRRLREQSIMGGYDQLTPALMGQETGYGDSGYAPEGDPWMGTISTPPPYMDPRDKGAEPWYGGQGGIGSTIAPQASSGVAGMGAPSPIERVGAGPATQPIDPNASIDRTMTAVNRVFTPEHVDRDRLRTLMDAAPERQAPSFARALVAGALSQKAADPIATSEAVMYAPHRRNMADWTAKTEPFYKTAQLENQENVNERTLAGNVVTSQIAADRIASAERIAADKQRVAEFNAESTRIRARAQQYTASLGKGWDWDFSSTTLKKINKSTGEVVETGLPTDKMSEEDALILKNEGRVAAAQALSGMTMKGPDGRLYPYDPTDPDKYMMPPRGSVPLPGGGGRGNNASAAKEASPDDIKKTQQLEWKRLRDTDQEVRDNTVVKGNSIELADPPTGWFGMAPNAEKLKAWERTRDKLHPTVKGLGTSTPPPGPPANTPPAKQSSSTGLGPRREVAARASAPPPPKEAGPGAIKTVKLPEEKPYVSKYPKNRPVQPNKEGEPNNISGGRVTGSAVWGAENPAWLGAEPRLDEPGPGLGYSNPIPGGGNLITRRTKDIQLPAPGTTENPARTEEELQSAIDYENLQQQAIAQLQRDGVKVTQKRIDWLINSGQLGNKVR